MQRDFDSRSGSARVARWRHSYPACRRRFTVAAAAYLPLHATHSKRNPQCPGGMHMRWTPPNARFMKEGGACAPRRGRTTAQTDAVTLVTFCENSMTVVIGESWSRVTSARATASAKMAWNADPTNDATAVQLKLGLQTDAVAVAETYASAYASARACAMDRPSTVKRELPAACMGRTSPLRLRPGLKSCFSVAFRRMVEVAMNMAAVITRVEGRRRLTELITK